MDNQSLEYIGNSEIVLIGIGEDFDNREDALDAYNKLFELVKDKRHFVISLCVLELGVGLKYPTVIRFPFEKIVFVNNKAVMLRVNRKLYQSTEELKEKCVGIKADPIDYINQVE